MSTPSGSHLDPAVAAARAGKHVIVGKPLEVTPERCDRIIAAADRAGVPCAGVFPSRFYDGPRRLKPAIVGGDLGRLVAGHASVWWHRSQEYYDASGWRGTWKLDGGGALMNQGIHSVDLLSWLMGPVDEVQAYAGTLGHDRIEVEDVAVAALRFSSGVRAEQCQRSGGRGDTGTPRAVPRHVEAVESGRQPILDAREARKAVAVVSAIYRSAAEHRPVRPG